METANKRSTNNLPKPAEQCNSNGKENVVRVKVKNKKLDEICPIKFDGKAVKRGLDLSCNSPPVR